MFLLLKGVSIWILCALMTLLLVSPLILSTKSRFTRTDLKKHFYERRLDLDLEADARQKDA